MRRPFLRALSLAFLLPASMPATDNGLHPISQPLPQGELRVVLRNLGAAGRTVAVECTYRAHRERDVRKERSFHLLGSIWRSGSHELIKVHRDEAHVTSQVVEIGPEGLDVVVPWHPADPDHRLYGLHRVRIGRLEFERWTAEPPALDAGFGMRVTDDALLGTVRLDGLGAPPLAGALPLWPSLRRIELDISDARRPRIELWDPLKKHHWDGWRQTTPQEWPGGRTILARQAKHFTAWWAHEYHAFPPGSEPFPAKPIPPPGAVPGVGLEVYWPEGDVLEFPEVSFERPAAVLALPLNRLTPRARQILADSAALRPGVELHSVSADEWKELDALAAPDPSEAVGWEMKTLDEQKTVLVGRRRSLPEAWLYLFGVEYDQERRVAFASLAVHPTRWPGPLPED